MQRACHCCIGLIHSHEASVRRPKALKASCSSSSTAMSMPPSTSPDPRETPICSFFEKGRCRFGQNCKKRHILNIQSPSVATTHLAEASQADTPATSLQNKKNVQSGSSVVGGTTSGSLTQVNKPCFDWLRAGSCHRGDKCWYRHDTERQTATTAETGFRRNKGVKLDATAQGSRKSKTVQRNRKEQHPPREEEEKLPQEREERRQEVERLHREVEQERLRRQEEERLRREAAEEKRRREAEAKLAEIARRQAEIERRRIEAEQLRRQEAARREERNRLEEAKVIKHVVLGALVSFGAGANVNQVLTGFESCRVRIMELPIDAKPREVSGILRDQGIDEDKFHLVGFKPYRGMKEANFIVEGESGRSLALGLDGIDFRGKTLKIEASDTGTLDGMHCDDATLSVSWQIPSSRFVISYFSTDDADRMKTAQDGRTIRGHKIKVTFNRLRGNAGLDPYSLFVTALPQDVTMDEITTLFEAPLPPRELFGNRRYNEQLVEPWLKQRVRDIVGEESLQFEALKTNLVQHSLYIHFRSWEDAKKVHDHLENKKFDCIGNSTFRIWLRDPYHIMIPKQQYTAQKTRWDGFVEDTKDQKESKVTLKVLTDKVLVRVGGMDMKAVGMLKVRVESLVAGEVLKDMWHTWFGTLEGKRFLETVYRSTTAFIRQDWRLKHMKAFGDEGAVVRAREMLREELDRLSGQEYTATLKQHCIRYFVQHGLAKLKEAFGEDSVKLDISTSPCRVTIRGGPDAHHLLKTLIEESFLNVRTDFSASSDSTCPICLGEVSNPVGLSCGHEYCTACIRHFFTADINRFPIVCVGDDAKCMKPIALPMIQRFLTDTQFNAFLETAFVTHVEQNPKLFRYCKTPDCTQIYACTPNPLVRHCPSCLVPICTQCHEEGHEGMTCEERKAYTNPEEQERLNNEWANNAGVKRCPQCQVFIEKVTGCNHMSCKCGAHICWVCMRVFTDGHQVYEHMGAEHGGFYDRQEPLVANEDYEAQVRELRRYENGADGVRGHIWGVPADYGLLHQAAQEERRLREIQRNHVEQLVELQAAQRREDARRAGLARLDRERRREVAEARRVRQGPCVEAYIAEMRRQDEPRDRGWCTIM
ncbi:hypothetical protein E1B28_012577 [Marasmius oreades]|uniref:RBR-type E3 ubiquitin transferase n=1 Tax=Marasmius oreades TaxID=181124 RepID=A0A9P7RT54_9AGAR|nr:uncharacterized protein E1B28_012577 [Marasmius oreades]KAG7088603.1 hypothetical protein E1B28_012577 [Marasmius oreades]